MRVFISSTFSDLVDYREAVTRAVLAAGDIPEDMLYWPAEESRPIDVCLRRLHASDLLILILAHRYGFIPSGYEKSITEIEFDAAISSHKSVLAFCVDEGHPWPPAFIERDEATFSRLRSFRARVAESLMTRYFTTPESLEAVVSQAVSHYRSESFDLAGRGGDGIEARSVCRRECLLYSPDSLVMVGRAPDGAPLLLNIERRVNLGSVIDDIGKKIGKAVDDGYIVNMKKDVAFHSKAFSLSRGMQDAIFNNESSIGIYASNKPIGRLLGANLLQILAGHAAPSPREDVTHEITRRSGIESRSGLDARVTSVGGENRFLCLPIDEEEVAWTGGWSSEDFVLWRKFIEESLVIFHGAEYSIWHESKEGLRRRLARTEDPVEFHHRWKEILSSRRAASAGRFFHDIKISRHSYIEAILEVVRAVAKSHELNSIHGDIKPSNILITARGVDLIDEIGLAPFEVAPTVTIGWSSPEQLCRQPLSFAADIYSLGLLFVRGLGCELLGREVRFRLPGGAEAISMDDPAVYLYPSESYFSSSARKGWIDALERCLCSDPSRRWPTAGAFAEAIAELLSGHTLKGSISMSFPWGNAPTLVITAQREVESVWILSDKWDNASSR